MSSTSRPLRSACHQLLESADHLAVDDDLGEAQHPGPLDELEPSAGSFARLISSKGSSRSAQELLRAQAEGARLGRVDGDLDHYFTKYRKARLPGPVKTEAVVLRSLRFGEADRILHLYTPRRGRSARSPRACAARAAGSAVAWSPSSASS